MPFSALTLPELLLGELGPDPGALLHAESAGERQWLGQALRDSRSVASTCKPAGWHKPKQEEHGRDSEVGNRRLTPDSSALLLTSWWVRTLRGPLQSPLGCARYPFHGSAGFPDSLKHLRVSC